MVNPDVEKKVVDVFYETAVAGIDEKGIFPLPLVAMQKDGTLLLESLAINPEETYHVFIRKIVKNEVDAIMLGLDRTTKEGQGTEFADVLTCVFWSAQDDWTEPGAWRKWLKFAVVNYQNEPRIARPLDWSNEFWAKHMGEELESIQVSRRGVSL